MEAGEDHPNHQDGKDPQKTSSYRPISLTSHIAKLAERMVGACLNHIAERDELVPPEQVGFRRGRTAEEHVGRLVQHVQDGWKPAEAAGSSGGGSDGREVRPALIRLRPGL